MSIVGYYILDGSEVVKSMSEEEQCNFFLRHSECVILHVKEWQILTDKVLRCISLSMCENLLELDLSRSSVSVSHFEILLPRMKKLRVLRLSNCPKVDGHCMDLLTRICYSSLHEIYVNNCVQFRAEPLLWIAGTV